MNYWAVPRMWEGRTVAIFAGGSSLSVSDVALIRETQAPVIVVNDAYKLAPWADLLYAADFDWWRVRWLDVRLFEGLKVTVGDRTIHPDIQSLRNTGRKGFDPDPTCIRTGGNSGYQAIHIAIASGAARILLLGYDMTGTHWFGNHKPPLADPPPSSFDIWIPAFEGLNGHGADIINCSPISKITCFEKGSLEKEIEALGTWHR